jgi:hypothetical protein
VANLAQFGFRVMMRRRKEIGGKRRMSKVLIEVHDAGVQGEHAGAHLAVGDGRANRAALIVLKLGTLRRSMISERTSKRKGKWAQIGFENRGKKG